MRFNIDRLVREHLEEAYQLSAQVGWNQTVGDWRRLIELNPASCFGGFLDGRLAATATLSCYDKVAWVGMVIVDQLHRNRGYGSAVLEHVMELARELGIDRIGLDATEDGRRIYRKFGFQDIRPIERWTGSLQHSGRDFETRPVDARDIPSLVEYDRNSSRFDRSRFLRRLLSEPPNRAWLIDERSQLRGYVILRPGRQFWHLGPLVADSQAHFEALLRAAAVTLKRESVLADCLIDHDRSKALQDNGLTPQRRLMRMALEGDLSGFDSSKSFLAAGFEWG